MKKVMLGAILSAVSMVAVADGNNAKNGWVGGVSYANFSQNEDGFDISLGAIVGSIGYQNQIGNNFYLIPEFRLGFGITDDSVTVYGIDADLELDRFVALSIRGQYETESGVYVYAAPAYANAKFTASASYSGYSASSSSDSWELGLGLGLGYNFSDSTSAEISYEQFDDTDVLSVGMKFKF